MKKINNFFECSIDAEYSLTKENICNVTKGTIRTTAPRSSIFAMGEFTLAIAVHSGTHAYASHKDAVSYAEGSESSAYALVEGSKAEATGLGATAYATCQESISFATDGAKNIPYPIEIPIKVKKK